jgi:hypothetical protein
MAENQSIDVRVYYQSLSKKDKGKFLRYLTQRYEYPTATMSGKLRKNNVSELRRDELENITKTIETGVWRQ